MKSVGIECLTMDPFLEGTGNHIYKINTFAVEVTEKKRIVVILRENLKDFP